MPGSDDWCTPEDLCADLGAFNLDPCSNLYSKVQAQTSILTQEWLHGATYGQFVSGRSAFCGNGLDLSHHQRIADGLKVYRTDLSLFCNPPYSDVYPWADMLQGYNHWVALVKLDPSTKWWARLINKASWRPFRHRVKFWRVDKPPLTANFPSALVWRGWWPSDAISKRIWMHYD